MKIRATDITQKAVISAAKKSEIPETQKYNIEFLKKAFQVKPGIFRYDNAKNVNICMVVNALRPINEEVLEILVDNSIYIANGVVISYQALLNQDFLLDINLTAKDHRFLVEFFRKKGNVINSQLIFENAIRLGHANYKNSFMSRCTSVDTEIDDQIAINLMNLKYAKSIEPFRLNDFKVTESTGKQFISARQLVLISPLGHYQHILAQQTVKNNSFGEESIENNRSFIERPQNRSWIERVARQEDKYRNR